jgi:Icc-related predicted phosphoesterase
MRICHTSDNHGHIGKLYGKYDIVLNTGDFFPNSHHAKNGDRVREAKFQLQWLRDSIPYINEQLGSHPFLYVPGNHDYMHPHTVEFELQSAGVEAYCISDRLFTFSGVNFYGFPYVPYIDGSYNYERHLPEMQEEIDKMVEILNSTHVDVLACHAPPYMTLDLNFTNERFGNTALSNALDYKINKNMMPSTLLFGHVHDPYGMTMRDGVLCVNSATTQHIVEI